MFPRGYDYNRLRLWDDRLRMPQFRFARSHRREGESYEEFTARQKREAKGEYDVTAEKEEAEAREAVMTFILGLTADPIPQKYVNNPGPEKQAEVLGRQVLEKYNCGGCHQIRPGVYDFKATEGLVRALQARYDSPAMVKDRASDHVFMQHSAWVGTTPTSDQLRAFGYIEKRAAQGGKADEAATDVIRLTEALRFHGTDRILRDLPAGSEINLPRGQYSAASPFGGTWTDLMVPYMQRKVTDYKDNADMARGTLPPPLVREGERVQAEWLYRFLLNPTPLRAQNYVILRMPKFNMSPDEARILVNYFAAAAKTTNPGAGVTTFATIPQRDEAYWQRAIQQQEEAVKARQKTVKADLTRLKPEADKVLKEEQRLKGEIEKLNKDLERLKSEAEKLEEAIQKKDAKKDALKKQLDEKLKQFEKVSETLEAKNKELEGTKAKLTPWNEANAMEKRIQAYLASKENLPKEVKHRDLYSVGAYRVMAKLCMQCHSIGHRESDGPKGPNLMLTADRLRPEWVEQWIANPKRLFTYPPVMPQNFPNSHNPLEWIEQELLVGEPRLQVTAVRDLLMDQSRLADLLALPPPPPPLAAGGK